LRPSKRKPVNELNSEGPISRAKRSGEVSQ
jgi:hypothetical protein